MRHRPQRWDPTSSHMRQFPSVSFWHTEHHLSELHFPPATASIQNQHCYFWKIVACHSQKERVFCLSVYLFVAVVLAKVISWSNLKRRLCCHSQGFFQGALSFERQRNMEIKYKPVICVCIHSFRSLSSVFSHTWRARAGVKSAGKGHQALITTSHWPWEENKSFAPTETNTHINWHNKYLERKLGCMCTLLGSGLSFSLLAVAAFSAAFFCLCGPWPKKM